MSGVTRTRDTQRRWSDSNSHDEIRWICTIRGWHPVVPVGVAIAQAAERNDPASHRITADGVVHMQELLEEPQSDEGFILHVVERADGL